jgi:hypothetical protein
VYVYRYLKKLLLKVFKLNGAAKKLRVAIEKALRASGRVKMTDTRRKLVLDALCKMPEITARAISSQDNTEAFEANGQNVDGMPSYRRMVNTCIRDLTDKEEKLLWKHLPEMIQLVDKPELHDVPEPAPGANTHARCARTHMYIP